MTKAAFSVLVAILVAMFSTVTPQAYSTFAKWSANTASFYINPQNADVTADAAEGAVLAGMNAWSNVSGSGFRYLYGGRVNDTTTGYDNRNVVMFRGATNGSAIATTYSWWSGSTLLDSDIVFWDAAFVFYTGTDGCSGGVYIEDAATHELGHALGLNHSSDAAATMYPSYSYCSQEMRTLGSDDIAAAQALYPGGGAGVNTAPVVSITSPAANATFTQGTVISFVGSASDTQDGSLTSRINWTSSLDGPIGTGGSVSRSLSAGTHLITASVTDAGGLTTSAQMTVTVTTAASGISLSARPYKAKGAQKVDLSWSTSTTYGLVDVFRNDAKVSTISNTGAMTDSIGTKGGGTYRYQICGSGSAVCSNQVTVTF